jgi:cystathionine beta-lyase
MDYDFNKIIDRQGTNSVKWSPDFLEKMFGSGDLLSMWVADMDFRCPQPVVDALVERAQHGIYGYSEREDSYFESIIAWNKRRNDWELEKEWILYTPGIVPAINYLIQAFCYSGDKVIIQNPVYYPFLNAIKNNGCHEALNPLIFDGDRYTIDFEDLEKQAKDPRVKMMILCSPHNPVGRVWTVEELTKVGEICLENNVIVVSDEIHSDLILEGNKHTPFAKISEAFAQNSITCTAPSKTFNLAGLQMSNIIIQNEQLRTKFSNILENNSISIPNCFGIVALETAYNEGEEWLDQVLEYLNGNMQFIDAFVKERIPEIKFIKPEGTYLAWLDFSSLGLSEIELEKWMQNDVKLALDEGYIFGKGGEGFERFNVACPREILEEALTRIEKAMKSR